MLRQRSMELIVTSTIHVSPLPSDEDCNKAIGDKCRLIHVHSVCHKDSTVAYIVIMTFSDMCQTFTDGLII